MKKLLFAAALIPSLAFAADPVPLKLEFSPQEIQVLMNLLDVAVKSCGITCTSNVVYFQNKFTAPAVPPA